MKALFFLSLILVGAFAGSIEEQLLKDLWSQWKLNNNKVYTSYEEEFRFNVFADNYLNILAVNAEDDSLTLALNHFADLTSEEFGAIYTGTIASVNQGPFAAYEPRDLPTSVDWRTKGAVTPVKNQGTCGSCWTFSTTGSLEGLYFIDNNNLVSFSEQNLVDCVKADQGCNGGLMSDALAYAAANGIETEADYPYAGVDQKCKFEASKATKVNSAYANVTAGSLDALKTAVAAQPVSIAVQANQISWQFYAGGVIKKLCGDKLDHGVLAVGYNTINGDEAWIVKNSWGASWGNEGYVYISTDASANKGMGVCGILSTPSYPTK
jgi:C1A family cysteine protease